MKLPIKWLKEFIDTDLPVSEIAEKFTLAGFLVENIDRDILELEITPNRGDVLSVYGLAREFGAITNKKIKSPHPKIDEKSLDLNINLDIDSKICSRYSYRIIKDVEVKDSPEWIQKKLKSCGMRPVSNIVDITNLVMLELGQPLHAFDYDKLSNDKKMVVRFSKKGEKVITLDNTKHVLPENVIVIENNNKLIDLAGIMGGKNSETSQTTKTIILQAAVFDQATIRTASKKLNFSTDASYRYERGVDPEMTSQALDRATDLILKTAGGKAGKITDIIFKKNKPAITRANSKSINNLLGTNISQKEISYILKKLGFKIKPESNLEITPPSWRIYDIKHPEDIAEEVARIYGYNNIKPTQLKNQKPANINYEFLAEQKIAQILDKAGFIETLSYSFVKEKDLKINGYNTEDSYKIQNPMSLEYEYLRQGMVPNILKQIAKNPWASEIKLYEIGNVFSHQNGEKKELIIVTTGSSKQFNPLISELEKSLNLKNIDCQIESVKDEILKYYKIRKPIQILKINLENLLKNVSVSCKDLDFETPQIDIKYKPISKYPPVVRDLAFIVDKNTDAFKILQTIQNISNKVFIVELFDEFVSDKFGKNKKNLAFHICFSSSTKTLKDAGIKHIIDKIIKTLIEQYQANLRNF